MLSRVRRRARRHRESGEPRRRGAARRELRAGVAAAGGAARAARRSARARRRPHGRGAARPGARGCATLDEAVADAVLGRRLLGASRRAPSGAARCRRCRRWLAARAPSGRVALVFGPEDAGLAGADVDRCDVVATIDLPGALPSLNLTQAVAIALWELARRPSDAAAPAARAQATRAELDALVAHAARVVAAAGSATTRTASGAACTCAACSPPPRSIRPTCAPCTVCAPSSTVERPCL